VIFRHLCLEPMNNIVDYRSPNDPQSSVRIKLGIAFGVASCFFAICGSALGAIIEVKFYNELHTRVLPGNMPAFGLIYLGLFLWALLILSVLLGMTGLVFAGRRGISWRHPGLVGILLTVLCITCLAVFG